MRVRVGQGDRKLVFGAGVAEELGIEPEAVELGAAEEVADPQGGPVAGGAVVDDHWVLAEVPGEHRLGGRV